MFGSVSDLIMAIATIIAAIFAFTAWKISKRTFRHQLINDLFKEFRSPEMGESIKKLYDFQRQCNNKEEIVSKYKNEYSQADESGSIHNHRRRVSSFFQQVSIIAYKDKKIKDIIFEVRQRQV